MERRVVKGWEGVESLERLDQWSKGMKRRVVKGWEGVGRRRVSKDDGWSGNIGKKDRGNGREEKREVKVMSKEVLQSGRKDGWSKAGWWSDKEMMIIAARRWNLQTKRGHFERAYIFTTRITSYYIVDSFRILYRHRSSSLRHAEFLIAAANTNAFKRTFPLDHRPHVRRH